MIGVTSINGVLLKFFFMLRGDFFVELGAYVCTASGGMHDVEIRNEEKTTPLILDEGKEESEEIKSAAINEFWMFWKKAVVHLESASRFTMEDQKYWPRIYLETSINEQHFPQGGGRYSYIIVDEFQDINPLDLSLIKAISEYHGHGEPVNLTIVGDDDQAIFGWRGTTPKFILEPEKYFGVKFETCILETNYRSPKDIVEPACRLISRNRQRIEKEMKSAAKGRAYLKVVSRKRLAASMEAVMTTVRKILENVNGGTVALIGRKQTALFPYQVMLSAEGIRYRVDADIDIFEGEAMQILQYIMRIIYRAKIDDNDKPNRIKIHFPGKSQPKVSCRRTQHCARTIPCPICYGKQTAGFPVNK